VTDSDFRRLLQEIATAESFSDAVRLIYDAIDNLTEPQYAAAVDALPERPS
jgi:hypothetical protein